MIDELISLINKSVNLSRSDVDLCLNHFETVQFPHGAIIEAEGKVPRYLYFIISGYVRLFYFDEKGTEITTHINCPPGFITSYFNFINQKISAENLQSITDCTLLRIDKANLDFLLEHSEAFKNYSIQVFEQALAYNETRAKEMATLSAEQRYKKLVKDYPGILKNAPVQYIASFLGMKPESLSRIRKKIS